ncbi:MAG: 4Fe-4S binding protein [Candidatus Bathyarchaeia archaeon]
MDWELIGNILKTIVLVGLGVAGIAAILIWKKNLTARVTYVRLVIQAVSFAALFYFFTFTVPLLYVLIIIIAATLVLGRMYCGWVCPFAFLLDVVTLLRKAFKIRHRSLPEKLNKSLHKSRYVIALFFLLIPIYLWLIQPPTDFNTALILAKVLGGPFRPYSVLIDPLIPNIVPWTGGAIALFQINFTYPYVQDIIAYFGQNIGQIVALAFIGLTLAGSFFTRRLWCRFCPTGISLAIVNRFNGFKWAPLFYIEKDEEKCTKCGVCSRVCPLQVTEVYEQKGGKINTSMCVVCARCAEMCPYEDTLKVKFANKTLFKSRNWLEPSSSE